MQDIKITLSILPGLNEYIDLCRRNKYQAAKFKEKTEDDIIAEIRYQGIRSIPGSNVYSFKWVERDKRRNKDNVSMARKFVFDAMVKAGMIDNDGWKQIAGGFKDDFDVDKENPRVEITITQEVQG